MPLSPALLRTLLCALTVLAAASCSSTKGRSDSSGERTFAQRLLKPDVEKKSRFDKEFQTASAGDRGNGTWLTRKGFHTSDNASGSKTFGGVHGFKTKDFSQGSKTSSFGTQESRFGTQSSRMGKETFATKDSRFGSQQARQGSQIFHSGDKEFKTDEFAAGMKSIRDNKRPMIEIGERDPQRNANAYSEAEVKRMLGR